MHLQLILPKIKYQHFKQAQAKSFQQLQEGKINNLEYKIAFFNVIKMSKPLLIKNRNKKLIRIKKIIYMKIKLNVKNYQKIKNNHRNNRKLIKNKYDIYMELEIESFIQNIYNYSILYYYIFFNFYINYLFN